MHRAAVLLLSVTLLKVADTGALRDVSLLVNPPVVQRGDNLELICNYDLDRSSSLYSIKFYRGFHEFYRFSPFDNPTVKLFPFPGLHVDLSQSQNNRVVVTSADFSLAGRVSCEVSTEGPDFSTSVASQNITVVELPRHPPRIDVEAVNPVYEAGDHLRGTCTSPASYPAPSLTWFINDEPAPSSTRHCNQTNHLVTCTVTLDLILLPRHVTSGPLTLRCSALVVPLFQETAIVELGTRGLGEPQHDRVHFSAAAPTSGLVPRLLVFSLVFLFSLR